MVLSTTGSIATYINTKFVLPTGVSGVLPTTVDLQRIKVQNFVGDDISSTAIPEKYQDIITDFSKADALGSVCLGINSSDIRWGSYNNRWCI